MSAACSFEEPEVSLSSQTGIHQLEKDKEHQLENPANTLNLGEMLSDEERAALAARREETARGRRRRTADSAADDAADDPHLSAVPIAEGD